MNVSNTRLTDFFFLLHFKDFKFHFFSSLYSVKGKKVENKYFLFYISANYWCDTKPEQDLGMARKGFS